MIHTPEQATRERPASASQHLAFTFLWSLVIAAWLPMPRLFANDQKSTSAPNIIFFLSDDHRWDRMGCAGHPYLKTPTMDRLAAQGVRFSNMFVTTSICAASRATLLTGLYERTHGYTFGTPPISDAHWRSSYPTLLQQNGYRTGFVGKFGVSVAGAAHRKSFDYFRPLNRNPYFHTLPDGSKRHESEVAGDKAIEFLSTCRPDQPFCLSVSFNAAHAEDGDKRPGVGHYPWPRAVDGMYEDIAIPSPRLSSPAIFAAHPDFLKQSMNRDRFFWRWDTPEKFATNLRAYYRMITGLDNVMARVLEQLQELGLADNTVIVFSGDNGYYEGQRGFAGKWSHYEESLRVPLIIYDPRAPESRRGQVASAMALNVDIPATIAAYAGIELPTGYQGRSLIPLMQGQQPPWRRDTFCEHLMDHAKIPKWEGVRGSRFVYARYFEQEPVYEFLHDLESDPDQLRNLASDPAFGDQLEMMRRRTNELRDRYGGPFDVERVRAWKRSR